MTCSVTSDCGVYGTIVCFREEVMYDAGRSGKEPWSMNQFRHLYNACRSPGLEEDNLHVHFKTGKWM